MTDSIIVYRSQYEAAVDRAIMSGEYGYVFGFIICWAICMVATAHFIESRVPTEYRGTWVTKCLWAFTVVDAYILYKFLAWLILFI